MWFNLFDNYNIRARLCPSLILLSPVLINMYLIIDIIRELSTTIVVFIVSLAISNLLILISRYQGDKKIEKILDKDVLADNILKPTNNILDNITKQRYYDFLNKNIKDVNLNMKCDNEDEYKTSIKWLKRQTRDKSKHSLIFEENINIGFCKNLYGLKCYGIVVSISLITILLVYSYIKFELSIVTIPLEIILSLCIDIMFLLIWIFAVNRKIINLTYKKYSLALLESCDTDK